MSQAPPPTPPAMRFPPPPTDPAQAQMQAIIQAAIGGPYPKFYANGFGLGITPSDVIVTIFCNGAPVCVMNLALPAAKGLAEDLITAIKDYERTSEQTVKTAGQIAITMERIKNATTQSVPPEQNENPTS